MRIYYYTFKTDKGTQVVKESTFKMALEKIEAKKVHSVKRTNRTLCS